MTWKVQKQSDKKLIFFDVVRSLFFEARCLDSIRRSRGQKYIDGNSLTCEVIFSRNKNRVDNGIYYWYANFIHRSMKNKNFLLLIYNFYTIRNCTQLYIIIYKLQFVTLNLHIIYKLHIITNYNLH